MTARPGNRGLSQRGRWILGASAAAALAWAWKPLSRLVLQLALALLLSALALPLCKRMEKKWPRPWAAGGAVALLALSLVGAIGLVTPPLIAQMTQVITEAPRLMEQLQQRWEQFVDLEWVKVLRLETDLPTRWISQWTAWLGESLPGILTGLMSAVDILSRTVLSPVLAFYFLRDREAFCYRLSLWIPARHRKRMLAALQEMRREAGGYVRGQLLVAGAVAVLTALGLLAVGAPAWLALGLLMGICEWIPYVGPLIGGIPIVLFSLPLGLRTLLSSLAVTIAVQQIEGYFLSPRLMAGATGLHPVYVLLLLSAGGLLWGLPGMMLALPLFVCVRGAARVLYESRKEIDNFLEER